MYSYDDINIESGTIDSNKIFFGSSGQEPEKVDWLLVDYGVSRSITPQRLYEEVSDSSPANLEDYHKRSIYVVNSGKILEFFSRLHFD
jgi:hypothetical protein